MSAEFPCDDFRSHSAMDEAGVRTFQSLSASTGEWSGVTRRSLRLRAKAEVRKKKEELELVKVLHALLEQSKASGRSAPQA